MAQTFTGRKRVRKVFGHVREVGEMPNLIEVQKASYDQFLLMDAPKGGRPFNKPPPERAPMRSRKSSNPT